VEEGGREADRWRKDELMANVSRYHGTEANIYSIECRTGDESSAYGGLERQRNHKAKGLIGSKGPGCTFNSVEFIK
jgi:hypothetical protein